MIDLVCGICHGDGRFHEFKCPFCNSVYFGSMAEGSRLRRHCSKCHFQWMDYEDFRYFIKTNDKCLACMGTGKIIIWGKEDE